MSTFSTLKIELIGAGEQAGVWGLTTNNNFGDTNPGSRGLEQAIVGMATLVTGDFVANVCTLTYADTNAAQDFRAFVLNVTATLTGAGEILVPAIEKPYLVFNDSIGGHAITIKVSGQTGVVVPHGSRMFVYNNGTDVGHAINTVNTITSTSITDSSLSTLQAVFTDASKRLVSNAVTGTGNVVMSNSPTLVTPALGTPASGILSGCTVDGIDEVGFRNIPQNVQTADYTLVLSDAGKHIFHPSSDATPRTFTIPANSSVSYPIGTTITFINQQGAGLVTIAITTDTMRLSPGGVTGSRTLAQNGSATCIKVDATEWLISGTSLS